MRTYFINTIYLVFIFLSSGSSLVLESAPNCPEKYGIQAYPHPESCNLFFLCTNSSLTVETCENGLLFDGRGSVYNHCNYHWAVECENRKADLTPISSPACEFQFGIYKDSKECSTHYIKCAHGEPIPQECTPGLVYDEKIHGCNWPDLLLESCNPESVVGFKCPTKVPSNSPAAKFWPYPRFPISGECNRFVTCVNGFPRLISCEDNKIFDKSTLTCEDSDYAQQCNGDFKK